MLNLERLRQWIEALRSGEFEQRAGTLKRRKVDGSGYRHCCLGVLCEVAMRDGVALTTTVTASGAIAFDHCHWAPPPAVNEWLGISTDMIKLVGPDGTRAEPIVANDAKRWTFDEIATGLELFGQEFIRGRR